MSIKKLLSATCCFLFAEECGLEGHGFHILVQVSRPKVSLIVKLRVGHR